MDTARDMTLVARTPGELTAAHATMIEWCDAKIADEREKAEELSRALGVAIESGWATGALDRQERIARQRAAMFEKMRAALGAGFVIVPAFPMTVFAIRTNAKKPRREESRGWRPNFAQEAQMLPAGEGRYVVARSRGLQAEGAGERQRRQAARGDHLLSEGMARHHRLPRGAGEARRDGGGTSGDGAAALRRNGSRARRERSAPRRSDDPRPLSQSNGDNILDGLGASVRRGE